MKRYESSFLINDKVKEVWDFLTQYSVFHKMKVVGQDPVKHVLFLNAPINFNTLGENMAILLEEVEPEINEEGEVVAEAATRVIVRSESKLRTAIMDMGKNRKNVEQVVNFIKAQLV